MAYTWQTPPTFAPNTTLTAAQMNTISNDLNYCKERLDALGTGAPGSTEQKSAGGAQGTLTATLGGVYIACGYAVFAAGSGFCSITTPWSGQAQSANATYQVYLGHAGAGRLNAGETITATASPSPTGGRFTITRIGP